MTKLTINKKYKAEVSALRNAIDRCTRTTHPQYNDYGGRGITVDPCFTCPNTGLIEFILDVGLKPHPDLTLDRKCNSLGYEPGNLQWVTRSENQKNRRPTRAVVHDLGYGMGNYDVIGRDGHKRSHKSPLLAKHGEIKTVKAWSGETGLSCKTITQRVNRGWDIDRVLDPSLYSPDGTRRDDRTTQ